MSGCVKVALIVGAIVVLLGVVATGCSILVVNRAADETDEFIDDSFGEADTDDYDIEMTSCEIDEFGYVEAAGIITNTSDTRQGFQIDVTFTDESGIQIDTQSGYTDSIAVDGDARWSISTLQQTEDPSIRCEITEVSYTFFD